mgnify:CR=1 FL=1
MSDRDRRGAKRVGCFAEAEIEGIDVSHRQQVRLADLSTGGAFIDVRTVLPTGTTARLRFTVLGRDISVLAEVRYSMPSFGMGVRFLDLRPEDQAFIEQFISQQA